MEYEIKAYLLDGKNLDCRFTMKCSSFQDVVEFLSRVPLTAYDVIKVNPVM